MRGQPEPERPPQKGADDGRGDEVAALDVRVAINQMDVMK